MTQFLFYLFKMVLLPRFTYAQLLILFACIVSILLPAPANAETPTETIVILDGSRSMWGRLERKRKYNIAVDAVEKILHHRTGKVPLGVIAFGHLRKKSCQSVEIIQDVSLSKTEESLVKLQKFRPRSFAPISRAMEIAAKKLDHENNPARLVLIVDGRDNCRKDPCKTLENIRKTSYDLSVKVIGLGMRKKDALRFQCFKKNNADSFDIVNTQKDLLTALFVATGTNQQLEPEPTYKRPKINENQITSHLKGNSRIKLLAVLSEGTAPVRQGVTWKVYKAITDSSFRGRPLAQSSESQPVIPVKPGKYIIEATFGLATTEAVVLAPQSGSLAHIINLNAGTLQIETKEKSDGETLEGVFYSIYKLNEYSQPGQRPIARSNDSITNFSLKSGKYLIIATHGGNRLKSIATIQAGEHAKLTLEMKTGILKLLTVASKGAEPLERIFYSVYKYDSSINAEDLKPQDEVSRTAASQPSLRLPAGRYIVKAEHDLAHAFQHVLVKPGQTTSAEINLKASTLKIRSTISTKDTPLRERISYRLISRQNTEKEIARTTEAEKTYILTPGKYKVIARYGSINVQKATNIELKPGSSKNLIVHYNAGTVTLALLDKKGKFPKINVFWTLYDEQNREIWRTSRPTPDMVLKVGKYKIRVESGKDQHEKKFEVKKGKNTEIKLEAN